MKFRKCRYCDGTGKEIDSPAVGEELRKLREKHGLTLREAARRMKLSPMFISDLERGRRDWTEIRINLYRSVVKK